MSELQINKVLICNKKPIKTVFKQGREFLVVPVVAAIATVMNGQLILKDELKKSIRSLNGKPVVIKHPDNKEGANLPDIPKFGSVFNARIDGNKLKADAWIDTQLLKSTGVEGIQLLEKIKNHEIIEVSLGWFQNTISQNGIMNGKQYHTIATDLNHDHLAILPDEIGACSVAEGCGLMQNANEDQSEMDFKSKFLEWLGVPAKEEVPTNNQKLPEEKNIMANKQQDPETPDVSEQFNKIMGSIQSLTDLVTNHQQKIDDLTKNQESMKKAPLVQKLVKNQKCPLSEEVLTGLSEEDLTGLIESYKEEPPKDFTGNLPTFNSANPPGSNGEELRFSEVES